MDTNTPKNVLATAIMIAAQKHCGQFDKGGMPYILHPLKVMHYLKTDDLELMAIAVLHDVVEDTPTTFKYLADMGISTRVLDGVRILTKHPGETNEEYMDGLKTNRDAMLVKLADLRHNSDIRRLKGVTEKDAQRLDKYVKMSHEITQYLKDNK